MEKYDVNSNYIVADLSNSLICKIRSTENIVILCVGSDKIVADLLGPMVGSLLRKNRINTYVYGSFNYCITAKNLKQAVDYINQKHNNPRIIVVDSAESEDIDYIGLSENGVNFYSLPNYFIGDYAILGFNIKRESGKIKLNYAKFSQIEKQANIIVSSLIKTFNYLNM